MRLNDMEIYKKYSKDETPATNKLPKIGLNKSMSEIRNILEEKDE